MVNNYNDFKLEYKLDQYFEGNLTLEELNLDAINLVNEGLKDFLTNKLGTLLSKHQNGHLKLLKVE